MSKTEEEKLAAKEAKAAKKAEKAAEKKEKQVVKKIKQQEAKQKALDMLDDVKIVAGVKADDAVAAIKNTGKKAKEAAHIIDASAKTTAEKIKDSKVGEGVTQVGETVSGAIGIAAKATSITAVKAGAKVADKVENAKSSTKASIKKVKDASKNAQVEVLSFIDKQKNKKFLEAKRSAFEDGIKQGKIETVDQIKKYTNFMLAIAALSYFFARCDGELSEAEKQEIDKDLASFLKNKDLPSYVPDTLTSISEKEDICFDDVVKYLDNVGYGTLLELEDDVKEIMYADDVCTDEESQAYKAFLNYCELRMVSSDE